MKLIPHTMRTDPPFTAVAWRALGEVFIVTVGKFTTRCARLT